MPSLSGLMRLWIVTSVAWFFIAAGWLHWQKETAFSACYEPARQAMERYSIEGHPLTNASGVAAFVQETLKECQQSEKDWHNAPPWWYGLHLNSILFVVLMPTALIWLGVYGPIRWIVRGFQRDPVPSGH